MDFRFCFEERKESMMESSREAIEMSKLSSDYNPSALPFPMNMNGRREVRQKVGRNKGARRSCKLCRVLREKERERGSRSHLLLNWSSGGDMVGDHGFFRVHYLVSHCSICLRLELKVASHRERERQEP